MALCHVATGTLAFEGEDFQRLPQRDPSGQDPLLPDRRLLRMSKPPQETEEPGAQGERKSDPSRARPVWPKEGGEEGLGPYGELPFGDKDPGVVRKMMDLGGIRVGPDPRVSDRQEI